MRSLILCTSPGKHERSETIAQYDEQGQLFEDEPPRDEAFSVGETSCINKETDMQAIC